MRAAWRFSLWASLAAAAPAAAQTVPTREYSIQGPVEAPPPTATQDLAFRLDRDERMTVAVRLGDKGPFRFLVDTGASRTVISTALAAAMGLTDGPLVKLHSVSGTSLVRTATVPRLELGRDRVRSVEAALLDAGHMGADGIVGVDSLGSEKVIFDFRTRVISIVPARQRVRDDPGTIVVRGKLRQGHLIVTSATANRVPLMAVLDTGSEMTMGNAALRSKLEERGRLGAAEPVAMKSVTGQIMIGEAFVLKKVTIGDVALHDLVILFNRAPIFTQLGLDDRPALLLGMNALRAFDKVSIDFVRKQLRMTVSGASPQ
jgi:predicted aspartyl protease